MQCIAVFKLVLKLSETCVRVGVFQAVFYYEQGPWAAKAA